MEIHGKSFRTINDTSHANVIIVKISSGLHACKNIYECTIHLYFQRNLNMVTRR